MAYDESHVDGAPVAARSRPVDAAPLEVQEDARVLDRRLAAAIAAGDRTALARAYERYGRLVYSVSLRVTGDPALAEECTQDAFVTLWRRAASYDAQRAGLGTWLFAVARNRALDHVRRRARLDDSRAAFAADGPDEDPAVLVSAADRAQRLAEAMAALPPAQHESLQMAYFDGLSHAEIAERLGVPLGTVKGRIRLALERLRTLARLEPDLA